MSEIIIVVGSITSATRLARHINKQSVSGAKVVSTPDGLKDHLSCSYSVKTSLSNETVVRNNLEGLNIRGIYIEKKEGKERFYYDISR